ncbi:MAG: hypothetical protein F6K36_03115 [Symploca sp. SIO3C6]|nr:hypothetical protein [Symploca sp. SIO3C6]
MVHIEKVRDTVKHKQLCPNNVLVSRASLRVPASYKSGETLVDKLHVYALHNNCLHPCRFNANRGQTEDSLACGMQPEVKFYSRV